MAFARSVQKAAKINKLKNVLIEEKQYAISISKGEKPKLSTRLKIRHARLKCRRKVGNFFKKLIPFSENQKCQKFCFKLRKNGSCENFTLKSFIGFLSGIVLTYLFFIIFVFQLNLKFGTATIMCSIIGGILTIGLAFSYKVRCVVLLLLPTFFSKRGRQALLAYAFILSITGPAKNTLNNMGILNESLACGQEQMKEILRQIIDAIKRPFYAIKDALKIVVKTVKNVVKKIKEILLSIKRIILSTVKVFKAVFQFLAKIFSVCNKEVGTPSERCSRAFEDAISDCNAKLGPYFNWLCSVTYLVKGVCHIVKIVDFICILVDFISNSVVGVILRRIKIFVRHIKSMFYVRLKFSHSFHMETNQSKSISEVTAGIATEIKNRTQRLVQLFDIMSCAASLFFVFAVFKVIYYRHQFLTSETFDNRYITKDFRLLDMRRAQTGAETVLPLNHRERKKFISSTSIRLVQSEKRKLVKAAMVVLVATVKMTVYILVDYALFWILTMIRYHARFQSHVKAPSMPTLQVTGNGFIAKLLRSIVMAFQPIGLQIEVDTIPCLPDPIPPDFDRYIQIASCIILSWILAILEPYGLRMRHSVMCYYHPTRARERAIWLFNHILSARRSFLKFARRQLRRKVMGDKTIAKETFKQFFVNHLIDRCPCFKRCIKVDKVEACLLCGEMLQDPTSSVRCQTPGCPGIYCKICHDDLKNVCTICQDPIEYGDFSDVDEEKDSSEEESKNSKKPEESDEKSEEKDEFSDSGRETEYSGSSTEYSESYQKADKKFKPYVENISRSSPDVEKQDVPNYASMQIFDGPQTGDDETGTSDTVISDSSVKSKNRKRKLTKRQRKQSIRSKKSRFVQNKKQKFKDIGETNKPDRSDSSPNKIVHFDTESEESNKEELNHQTYKDKNAERNNISVRRDDSTDSNTSQTNLSSFDSDTDQKMRPQITPFRESSDTKSASDSHASFENSPLKTKSIIPKKKNNEHKSFSDKKTLKNRNKFYQNLETETESETNSVDDSEISPLIQNSKKTIVKSKGTQFSNMKSVETKTSESLIKGKSLKLNKETRKGKRDHILGPPPPPLPPSLVSSPHLTKNTQNRLKSHGTKNSSRSRNQYLNDPPPPPSLPQSLQTSPHFTEEEIKNTLHQLKKSTKIEHPSKFESQKHDQHLRGGEDSESPLSPEQNVRRFLTGPRKFKVRSSKYSPISFSHVIAELKNVLTNKSLKIQNEKVSEVFVDHPLPPLPETVTPRTSIPKHFTEFSPKRNRLRTPAFSKLKRKLFSVSSNVQACSNRNNNIELKPLITTFPKIERERSYKTTKLMRTPKKFRSFPPVQERIKAFENVSSNFCSPDYSPKKINFRQQVDNRSQHKIDQNLRIPQLELDSSESSNRVEKIVDHCNCSCELTKNVSYHINNEKQNVISPRCFLNSSRRKCYICGQYEGRLSHMYKHEP